MVLSATFLVLIGAAGGVGVCGVGIMCMYFSCVFSLCCTVLKCVKPSLHETRPTHQTTTQTAQSPSV